MVREYRLGSPLRSDLAKAPVDVGNGVVPRDALEGRVTLQSDTPHWIEEAILMVQPAVEPRDFATNESLGDGIIASGSDLDNSVSLDRHGKRTRIWAIQRADSRVNGGHTPI